MKKMCCTILAIILMMAISLVPVNADETGSVKFVEGKGTCLNHNFSTFVGYSSSQNQHTYRCSNTGCTAYIVEECYNYAFCGYYLDVETLNCQKCSRGTIYIHNYEAHHEFYDDDFYHIQTCTNTDPYGYTGMCGKTTGNYTACTLETRQIWRGFRENRGHYLTQTCAVCDYQYNVGYHYPNHHPNYFSVDNNCIFCKMNAPYHMDW